MQTTTGRLIVRAGIFALAAAASAAVWLPAVHLLFRPSLKSIDPGQTGVPSMAKELAEYQLSLWEDPVLRGAEIARMRRSNAEWDFMGRTYLVLALANMSLREPASRERHLAVIDRIIEETEAIEEENGALMFLMDYARAQPFIEPSQRSVFVDGEIALMIGARRLVEEDEGRKPGFAERVSQIRAQMEAGPVLCAESYPNECWMFCNAVALAAMRMSDVLDGTDHSEFFGRWTRTARERLTHRESGMLVSSFAWEGDTFDGPEGSSVFMVAHCLQIVDAEFAQDQYARARRELGRSILGFGLAREWPASFAGHRDVDSGPVVPLVDASAGASGMAILGAASFGDIGYLRELATSLEFAAFPMEETKGRRYGASNQVGDAVILYSLVQGPLWKKIGAGGEGNGA